MQTAEIKIDRQLARELWRAYKTHQHYSEPIDYEIQRTYQLIAQGRTIIQALESIKLAGLGADGFPKLAIARADQKSTFARVEKDGSAVLAPHEQLDRWRHRPGTSSLRFDWPAGAFGSPETWKWRGEAIVPLIPIHLRPKRALENYHILWDAEWARVVPRDPLLLRRIGKADIWLVLAHWDLTPVERAALTVRVNTT